MKISFMTFACPEWSLTQVLEAARRHGYHGLELRVGSSHGHGVEISCTPEQRAEARAQVDAAGVELPCLATSLKLIDPACLEQSRAMAQLAADLGCPALRIFCGGLNPDEPAAEQFRRAGQRLREMAQITGAFGVKLLLETHDSISKAVDAATVLRAAGDPPGVSYNYDNMHPYRMGEPLAETFKALEGRIGHSHFHDAVNAADQVQITPLGQGQMPMDEMFAALRETGYAGYLSGEWFGQQYGATPDESLAAFRADMQTLADRHGARLD